ncbi:MAG: D-alanine--D-alanine ligase [Clostridiales bacterium]|nr:D-alanine--D-alanine ligase [Clostridiales bacterium]
MKDKNLNIVVLAGGLSPERNVSLASGTMVTNALLSLGHQAILVDLFYGLPHFDGHLGSLFASASPLPPYAVANDAPNLNAIAESRAGGYSEQIGRNVLEVCRAADLVFMALHGADGENGSVQGWLAQNGVLFTGSGAAACALAMDKAEAKLVFARNGILVPQSVLLCERDALPALHYPVVVKPNCGGSSLGVTIVQSEADMAAALTAAFALEERVLAEEYIAGREFSCGVLGDAALPVIEIVPKVGFYDYANKYQPGAAEEICPADLDAETTMRIQADALWVFEILRLDCYARMDFILDAGGRVYCLEANTLPGLTVTSLLPQEAAAAGLSYAALCAKIIELALEK